MEEVDLYGLCSLSPHPTTLPHYVTPANELPTLCPVSESISRKQDKGWAGMPKKPKPKKTRKRKPVRATVRKKAS